MESSIKLIKTWAEIYQAAKDDYSHVNIDGAYDLLVLTNTVGAGMAFFSALGFFSILIGEGLRTRKKIPGVRAIFRGPFERIEKIVLGLHGLHRRVHFALFACAIVAVREAGNDQNSSDRECTECVVAQIWPRAGSDRGLFTSI